MKTILFATLFTLSAFADPKDFYFKRLEAKKNARANKLEAQVFTQITDHFSPESSLGFSQRYWVESKFASGEEAPVFFYLCGEATCDAADGALTETARTFKAYIISLEHRYYGKSQPFKTLTTENLKYLSTEQALEDAATFQRFITKKLNLTGKWIVTGGSYAGSLAAYYRMRHSSLVAGALSSSGPVQAMANFEEYDHHVFKTVGKECADHMRVVVKKAEEALADPAALKTLKEKFEATVLKDDDDFLYLIADMGALAVQYGYRDRFCRTLASKGPLEGYAQFTKEIFKEWQMDALAMSVQAAVSENPDDYLAVFGMRGWMYQSCTEYGYWQNAYHDASESVRSTRINPAYHQNICKRLFGIEKPVDDDDTNMRLYYPILFEASRIFFTNGSRDPWMRLSVAKENGNDLNPETSALTIEGASHCDDLRSPKPTDSEALKTGRSLFVDLVKKWLE